MIKIKNIVTRLGELGVAIYLENGKLKTRSLPGCINDEVKSLIRENKESLIEFLELLEDSKKSIENIPKRDASEKNVPLSYAQQRLWLIDRMNAGSAEYNMPIKLRIRGEIDIKRLEESLRKVIRRHETLRTIFLEEDGEPKQEIRDEFEFKLDLIDFSTIKKFDLENRVDAEIEKNSHTTFDLKSDLMIRGSFIILDKVNEVVVDGLLLLCIHHIAGDGWSMGILIDDFTSFYQNQKNSLSNLDSLDIQYADYAVWQRRWISSSAYEKQEKYWLKQLEGVPAVHNISLDKERPSIKRYHGGQINSSLDKSMSKKLTALSQRYKVSEFVLIHAALSLVFSRHSGTNDIVIGTAVANRTRHELNRLVGFFVNTIALRVNTDFCDLADYLEHVRQVNLDAQTNQEVPFETIVEKLRLSRSSKYTPLVQLFFTMNTGLEGDISVEGLEFENYAGGNVVSKFDLSVSASFTSSGLMVSWVYDESIFEKSRVSAFSEHLMNCLQSMIENPFSSMEQVQFLSDKETRHLIYEMNQTDNPVVYEKLVHELFELQVEKQKILPSQDGVETLQKPALIYKDQPLSYASLNEKANQLARHLKSLGVGRDCIVGILLERTPDAVISMLAILKAGGAYLPLDTQYPQSRLKYILQDSGVDIVITRSKYFSILADATSLELIRKVDLDEPAFQAELSCLECSNLPKSSGQNLNQLAYVIYTSGSTGTPKGVMIEHKSFVNQNAFEVREFELSSEARVIHLFSFGFDPGTGHLFSGLTSGATIYIEDPRDNLINFINKNQITHAAFPTSLLMAQPYAVLPTLKVISVGGEKCDSETVKFWGDGRKFINLYGPTEATIYCTRSIYKGIDTSRCIGTPIDNCHCYVLDTNRCLVPIGAVGELYVGGACLARGYLNRDELTDASFVKNPFSNEPFSKLYRTGDLVRYGFDGQLEFIGRADDQVKIRGYRIELGEIEAQLTAHDLVRTSVVDLRESSPFEKQLVAYVVPSSKARENRIDDLQLLNAIKLSMQNQLPYYMQPSTYIVIDELPLSAGGKLDRAALPQPDIGAPISKVEPSTKEQHKLVEIWSRLLKKPADSFGVDSNFFELGGHSLLLVRMVSEIRNVFAVELDFRSLFQSPNINSIAQLITKAHTTTGSKQIMPVAREIDFFPMSFSQQRLWFIDQMNNGSPEYNMPLVLDVCGDFNVDAAELAIDLIIQRHESLRTRFVETEMGPGQIFIDDFEFQIERHDLQFTSSAIRETRAKELIQKITNHVFKLDNELLVKVAYIQLPKNNNFNKGILIFNMHHIVSDAWSMGVLVSEFVSNYRTIVAGSSVTIEPLEIQYADYSFWKNESLSTDIMKNQLDYWDNQLKDVPFVHGLPLDYKRPEVKKNKGGIVQDCIDKNFTQELIDFVRKSEITLFMLLHSALGIVLSRHSNSKDIVVGTPVANRTQKELEPLIGLFINTLVLRINTDFSDLDSYIQHIRQINLEAQEHQDVPFEFIVERCQVPRTTQHSPLFQILFTMDSTEEVSLNIPGVEFAVIENENINAKFDLTLSALYKDEKVYLSWVYDRSIFKEESVASFSKHFCNVLRDIVSHKKELREVSMLDSNEKDYLINSLNQTQSDYPRHQLIHHLFESQVTKTPEKIALVDYESQLSYEEFNSKANQLAHYLISLGVKPGDFVGLYIERSVDMMVGVMGIIKAGGAYVPLDPAHGTQRLEYCIKDTSMKVLITQSGLANDEDFIGRQILSGNLEDERIQLKYLVSLDSYEYAETVKNFCKNNPCLNLHKYEDILSNQENNIITSHSSVYLIYTSGSTGVPKGVEITHRGLIDYCFWGINNYYDSDLAGARIISSVSFDGTVTSLYFPLLVGGYVELVKPEITLDIFWQDLLESQMPLMIKITPSHIQGLVFDDNVKVSNVRHTFVIGGELLTMKVLSQLKRYFPDSNYYHHYGPTETVVGSTLLDLNEYQLNEKNQLDQIDEKQGFPIGKPMGNVQIYITDQELNLLPFGTPGELCIGGDGLAKGYLNHEKLTCEKFIKNPFSKNAGDKIYRTGDLVKYSPDGNINFIGRIDGQVKVRGYRIELGEIEQKILQLSEIKNTAVIVQKDSMGNNRIVAYIVSQSNKANDKDFVQQIKGALQEQLPDYMLPSLFVLLPEMKLNSSGKIDRKSLPLPDFSHQQEDYVPPETEVESALVSIWSGLLNIPEDKLSVTANFFEMGGDSILSIQVASRAAKRGFHFTTRDVFTKQNIRDLAKVVAKQKESRISQEATVGNAQLLPIQQRFLFSDGELHHYNQSVLLKTPANFNFECLKTIVEAIYRRHDALRLRFFKDENTWVANHQPFSSDMLMDSILNISLEESDFKSLTSIADKIQASFDLSNGPLFKVVYFVNSQNEGRLLLILHHLIVDGVSWRILLEDLSHLYTQINDKSSLVLGREGGLQELSISPKTDSYKRWGEFLHAYASSDALALERKYWIETLQESKCETKLSVQRSDAVLERSKLIKQYGNSKFILSAEITEKLLYQANKTYRTQINELLLASLFLAFNRHGGVKSIRIDLESHGRESLSKELDISQTVGWFTSVYPLSLKSDMSDLESIICDIKEQYRSIPNNGIGYGVLKYLAKDKELVDLSKTNGADILFNYLGQFDQVVNEREIFSPASESVGRTISPNHKFKHTLNFSGMVSNGELSFNLNYQNDHYLSDEMDGLMQSFKVALIQIVEHCLTHESRFTPADFPLLKSSLITRGVDLRTCQSQLNDWQSKYDIADIYAATGMQQGLIFHSEFESGAYVTQMQWCFNKGINLDYFRRAWQQLVDRHDIFKTAFVTSETGSIFQLVQKQAELNWCQINLEHLESIAQQDEIARLRMKDKEAGFIVSKAPLMRVSIFVLGRGRYQVLWSHHHALTDGWCLPLIFNEIMHHYQSLVKGTQISLPVPKPYRDFVAWLGEQDVNKAESFWSKQLINIDSPTPLPGDWNSSGERVRETIEFSLNQEETSVLVETVKFCRTTVNIALQAAWSYLLSRYSSQQNVVFGATISGRPSSLSGVEDMIGLFINTVPVVVDISNSQSIKELLGSLHAAQMEREDYSYLPLSKIQQLSSLPNGTPLFESLIIFENYPISEVLDAATEEAVFEVSSVDAFEGTNYALSISAALTKTLTINLEYDRQRFDNTFIVQLTEQLKMLLKVIAANPNGLLSDFCLLTDDSQNMLLNVLGNRSQVNKNIQVANESIFQLFEKQAKKTPHKAAVRGAGLELTYQELSERSSWLADELRSLGVKHGCRVGLSMERSPNILIGILGIMKSGAAYVPIDLSIPAKRIEHILKDAAIKYIVTQSEVTSNYSTWEDLTLVEIDKINNINKFGQFSGRCAESNAKSDEVESIDSTQSINNVAYVIYTSGTSGLPKGVEVSHLALSTHITQVVDYISCSSNDNILQLASFSFDASLEQTFSALISGSLLVISEATLLEPETFFQLLRQNEITITDLSPAFLNELLHPEWSENWDSINIRTIVVGGESISRSTVQRWFDLAISKNCNLYNAYGPTEAVITATMRRITESDSNLVGIGLPLGNRTTYILDRELRLVPPGALGELFIGGELLAKGYLNQPELDAERFIADPFDTKDGARLYRTGDLVRYLNDTLVFISRTDQQVKIRGYRIEIGEIEHQLVSSNLIDTAVVIESKRDNGQSYLAAYVVPNKNYFENIDEPVFIEKIKAEVSLQLPDYMMPSIFMVLRKLPITINGKLDRDALPKPDILENHIVAPQTMTERKLVEVWSNVLDLSTTRLSVTANFFDLGGHSLSAMRLKSEISKDMGVNITLKNIFLHPSIQMQARYINDNFDFDRQPQLAPVERNPLGMPLSFSQQRLWFIDQLDNTGAQYNMPNALMVEGLFNIDVAEKAIRKVIERHEVLRTSFVERNGEPVQIVNEVSDFKLLRYDFSNLPNDARDVELKRVVEENKRYIFDLASGCLVRAVYISLTNAKHNKKQQSSGALIFNLHHIVSDGWSMGILVDEFVSCYESIVSGSSEKLKPLSLQYADFAYWQRQNLNEQVLSEQLDYWQAYLDGAPSCHSLPLDRPRAERKGKSGLVTQILSDNLIQQISSVLKSNESTLFMLLQASLAVHIGRMTHETDVVIGSPNAGRGNKEIENLIGLFLNTQIFRTRFSSETTLESLLAETRESYLESLSYNETPFEAIVDRVKPPRVVEHSPIFQVLINFNNVGVSNAYLENLTFSPIVNESPENKFDITLYVNEEVNRDLRRITLSWVYDAGIFDIETMHKFTEEFEHLLVQMTAYPKNKITGLSWRKTTECPAVVTPNYSLPGNNVAELFEHWANVKPHAIALSSEGQNWSYEKLNQEVNQIANALVTRLGIQSTSRVAVALSRSHLRVKSILAILKIGACYVPLSEELPTERLRFMIEDSQPEIILTDKTTLSSHMWLKDISIEVDGKISQQKIQQPPKSIVLDSELFKSIIDAQPNSNPAIAHISNDDVAHIIYTSGSTGQPKGVKGTYGATFNRIAWMLSEIPFEEGEAMAHITSMAFIRGVWELLVPLCGGARMHLIDRKIVRQVDQLWKSLKTEKITRIVTAPTLMQAITEISESHIEDESNRGFNFGMSLKHWFVSGEPLLQVHAHKVLKNFAGLNVYNLYGSTEVMSDVLWHKIDDNDVRRNAPVGSKIDGVEVIIVDSSLQPVPDGVIGEIVVYGDALATGYTREQQLKNNPFVQTSFGNAYRTGDLGIKSKDGLIECLGRVDEQIKIRGYRIEPGEISFHLLQHDCVASCQVVVDAQHNDVRLLAYFIPNDNKTAIKKFEKTDNSENLAQELKRYLSLKIPVYMLPSAIIEVEDWPLRPNGKVDKNLLPKPDGNIFENSYIAPQTKFEKLVVESWANLLLLDCSKVSINTSFFELGGHSLLIIRMISMIEKSINIRLSVAEVMQRHTAKEIAELLEHYHLNKTLRETIEEKPSEEIERIKI